MVNIRKNNLKQQIQHFKTKIQNPRLKVNKFYLMSFLMIKNITRAFKQSWSIIKSKKNLLVFQSNQKSNFDTIRN